MSQTTTKQNTDQIRNLAIIAHVDHGKTTLVDGLLKQSKTFRDNQAEMSQELIMDSGDQEKERGITITAKITAVQHGDYRINIIDTPGHADFSGEVERTLNMADGCILIVDAQEGPMPQTKFVLERALEAGLKPIVIINKIDKPAARIKEVEDELADLFLELAVHEDQLHYPTYYAVGRAGKAWDTPPSDFEAAGDLEPIFEAIIKHVPAPKVELDKPFQMLVTALAWDTFKGKYAIGRISRGQVKAGDSVVLCQKDGQQVKAKVDLVFMSQGVSKFEVASGVAGDIVQLTGIADAKIGQQTEDEARGDRDDRQERRQARRRSPGREQAEIRQQIGDSRQRQAHGNRRLDDPRPGPHNQRRADDPSGKGRHRTAEQQHRIDANAEQDQEYDAFDHRRRRQAGDHRRRD